MVLDITDSRTSSLHDAVNLLIHTIVACTVSLDFATPLHYKLSMDENHLLD